MPEVHAAQSANQGAWERLEFSRVRDLLRSRAVSFAGREILGGLVPFPSRDEAELALARVHAIRRRGDEDVSLPGHDIADLRGPLGRLDRPGSVLEGDEFMALLPLLVGIRDVAAWMQDGEREFPELIGLAGHLAPMPHLERAVAETFEPSGEMRDGASTALRRIRRERESRRSRLRTQLERIASRVGGSESPGRVTLREGRYVVSVPGGEKARVPGLVLDRSGSGSTLFVEPMDAVEENNALRELDAEERVEMRRILSELTRRFAAHAGDLQEGFEQMGRIDALRARAELARTWRAELPVFGSDGRLELKGARHPMLLDARGDQAWTEVVPLDVSLESAARILLVTGPNMGGKTVALKTVGLITVLAQCGCLVPVAAETVLPWVSRWVVSLGDEQSLERDLSTFAAHLERWGEALTAAGPGTLVLLDELGSGTDPTEGAALARSVLEGLLESGAIGVVTTHLGMLKQFAAEADGIRNGSMVFDAGTRQPTYRLAAGLPGESHALEMAARLGFPADRVERAHELLPREEKDVRRLLAEIAVERQRLVAAREEAEQIRSEADRLHGQRRRELERFLEKRADLRARSARQARAIVRRAEETLRRVEKDARSSSGPVPGGRRALVRQQAELARIGAPRPRPATGTIPDRVNPGDRYWAEALAREVEVVRIGERPDRVLVLQNGVRVELPVSTLRTLTGSTPAPAPPPPSARREPAIGIPETEDVPSEIDLRGRRVEEALSEVDRALDRALLAGLKELRVIHGKGTGTLRAAISEFCREHRAVSSSRIAERELGGSGVTVIELEG